MLEISNCKVYDLKESVIACRNSMRIEQPTYSEGEFLQSLERAKKLCRAKAGSGESNFRKGIRVSFDIKYPNYISPELQRYNFVDIVCSTSKIHKLVKMDMDSCFNKYVTEDAKELMKRLVRQYNELPNYDNFMYVLSNCPLGVELYMRVSTNYEQLATIYRQRKNHRLKEDWGVFCKMIESLPYSNELITCKDEN